MTADWTIQSRSKQCAITNKEFIDGQYFYTLLFLEKDGFRREDLCEEAFKSQGKNTPPFSYWRSRYATPPAPEAEVVSKQTAEDLLRQYMLETGTEHTQARYILALMLERKRTLKEIEVKRGEDGSLTRIYEHSKSGEVFIIPDPQLKLSQVSEVQLKIAELLGATPRAESENTTAASK